MRFDMLLGGDLWKKQWALHARKRGSKLTPLSQDQLNIINMTCHALYSNWFEYQAGSRLVHLRFLLRHQRMACDGILVFFEHPGPTYKEPQPPYNATSICTGVWSKLEEVMH